MKNQSFPKRLSYAINGIVSTLKREQSFRIQLGSAVTVIAILLLMRANALWLSVFIAMIAVILAFELMNTALEHIIDRLHPEQHESIGLAKDCAAGAVLVLSAASVILFTVFLTAAFA